MLRELIRYSRMGLAFVRHLRSPLDPDPERKIRSYMENREEHFLAIARKVLGDAGHPYSRMFQIAGCTLADVEASVARCGVAEGSAQTEMILRIRPGACRTSGEEVLGYFLSETRGLYGGSMSALAWAHSRGVRVEWAAPLLSTTGKFRAVRLLGPGVAATEDRRRSLAAAAR